MNDESTTGTTFDRATTVHGEVERWVRGRGGRPVETPGEEGGLGFRFPDEGGDVEPMEWGTFFERFEDEGLAFAYDADPGAAAPGDACALIDRERAEEVASEPPAGPGERATSGRVGQPDPGPGAERRSAVRSGDARDQSNVDAHRDEPPFES